MDNLEIWNKLCQPPKEALKTIGGGRLKGMTDVNPQWRLKAMTEQFGAVGIGWKYRVIEHWNEEHDGQVACFVRIELFIRDGSAWSEPIEGLGGSMLLSQEKNGMYLSDEGYKMALTDALSVAMKQLGVAADIYAGLWDGSKYKEINNNNKDKKDVTPPPRTIEEILEDACKSWIKLYEKVVPENQIISPAKFNEALKEVYKKMPAKDKKSFKWDDEGVKMLVLMLKLEDTLEEIKE